jgi:uncharacterized protein (DUF3084 family)
MEFGLILIPILILVSGGIAFTGNLVGRSIGRRRLTLLGLRPRYTAQLITVATGMVITLITLATVLLVSRDARVALFQFRNLQSQIGSLKAEIKSAESRLKLLKSGDIAYQRNQEVLREIIDGRLPLAQIAALVDTLRLRAVDLALQNGINVDGATGSVLRLFPPNLTWDQVAELVKEHGGETIVRIVANENTLQGESLEVSIQLIDNRLVFSRGRVLGSGIVDGRRSRDEIARQLLEIVDRAKGAARREVISPPFTRITEAPFLEGDVDEVRRVVEAIVRSRGPVRLDVVVARDTYTIGPVIIHVRPRT